MLSVKQAKAFLVFAFAPSLSLKAADIAIQPMLLGGSSLLAKPIDVAHYFFGVVKKEKGDRSDDEDGHPLHEEEETDSYAMLRNKTLGDRKRSRKESE
jgi:hypothetical protein